MFAAERFIPAEGLPLLAQAEREVAAGDPPGGSAPGVAFLGALDPLIWDRDFLRALFDFDYVWEVYVPAAKRRWGYYVLPILFGDRLVGRIEPRIERKANELRVAGLWWEDGFDPLAEDGFVEAFAAAVEVASRVRRGRPGDMAANGPPSSVRAGGTGAAGATMTGSPVRRRERAPSRHRR